MNNIVFNAGKLLAILTIALATNTAKAQTAKETTQAKTITMTFIVTEMGCRTDSKMVETTLYRKKGVKSVKIVDDQVTVIFNPDKVKAQELITAIENTGTCEDPNAKVHKVKTKTE